jgi:hypothetical protein
VAAGATADETAKAAADVLAAAVADVLAKMADDEPAKAAADVLAATVADVPAKTAADKPAAVGAMQAGVQPTGPAGTLPGTKVAQRLRSPRTARPLECTSHWRPRCLRRSMQRRRRLATSRSLHPHTSHRPPCSTHPRPRPCSPRRCRRCTWGQRWPVRPAAAAACETGFVAVALGAKVAAARRAAAAATGMLAAPMATMGGAANARAAATSSSREAAGGKPGVEGCTERAPPHTMHLPQ